MAGPQTRETESEPLRIFRAAYEEGNRAWNEGDFKRAYGALPEDFEYHLAATWPQARPLRGPDEIVAFFEEWRETFPDTRSTLLEVTQAGERTFIAGFEVLGTGARSGALTKTEIWQLWELGDDLLPVRVREFNRRRDAFEAAGVAEPAGRNR